MSYQTGFGVFRDKAADSANPARQEEKKPSRKSSEASIKVTPNPIFTLSLNPSAPQKSLQKNDLSPSSSRVVTKEASPKTQPKTVTQKFGQAYPSSTSSKRSVGGSSLRPTLPHSKSAHFSVASSSTEDKVAHMTPRIKVPRTPRHPSLAAHIATLDVTPSFGNVGEAAQQLNEFTRLFQEQINLIQQVLASPSSSQSDKTAEPEEEQVALAYQMLSNALSEDWTELRKELDALLLDRQKDENEVREEFEDKPGSRTINLHNLGLDFQLDAEPTSSSRTTATGKTSLHKASLSLAKKSIKDERHLKIAFELMVDLLLDLQLSDPWNQKDNLRKMVQFVPTTSKQIDKTTPHHVIAFNYATQLFLLGEVLKQGSHRIESWSKTASPLLHPSIDHANKFIKAIREIKEIKHLDKDSKKEKIDLYCHQYGETITKYAKFLLKSYADYIEATGLMKTNIHYTTALASETLLRMSEAPLTPCPGFSNDFDRAYKGRFLYLASDKAECNIPKISQKIKSEQKRDAFCRDFLLFLKENLKIDSETHPSSSFNPFEALQTTSLDKIYDALEEHWTAYSQTTSTPKLEGIFKLLPILRFFNQTTLLVMHRSMVNMQKIVGTLDPALIVNNDKSCPDWKDKRIEIAFQNNTVYLTVKRLNYLNDNPNDANQLGWFIQYPVYSTLILSSPVDNMEQWKVEEQSVSIDRPAEISDPLILQRYSLLLTVLETTGLQHQINIVEEPRSSV